MRKNGFTLVELLAVIVILAIIALIAVPVFLGIINKSKNSSEKEGVNIYTDTVQKTIEKKQLSDPNFIPDKCTIKTDGNLECFKGTTSLGTVKVTMKGTKPTSGTIYIEEDDITYENIVLNGKTYYEKIISLIEDVSPSGISKGDKYSYRVNDKKIFTFYVLTEPNNNEVNLIMDNNICENGNAVDVDNNCTYAWNEGENGNSDGPYTAMTILYNATKDWDNVNSINFEYTDTENNNTGSYGYASTNIVNGVATITKIDGNANPIIGTSSEPLKARLPKLSELVDAGCHIRISDYDNGTCPAWLMSNLKYQNVSNYSGSGNTDKYSDNNNSNVNQNIAGYWLISSKATMRANAYRTLFFGYLADDLASTTGSYGIRPVITVSKSDL